LSHIEPQLRLVDNRSFHLRGAKTRSDADRGDAMVGSKTPDHERLISSVMPSLSMVDTTAALEVR
jgi:hypothetical protein